MRLRYRHVGSPLTNADLDELERRWHVRLPVPYRAFLLERNGGAPRPQSFRVPDGDDDDHVSVECFLAVGTSVWHRSFERQLANLRAGTTPLPPRLVPVADAGNGFMVLLSTGGKDAGRVYQFDPYAVEPDEDGFADVGCLTRLAKSFDAFVAGLRPADDDEDVPDWVDMVDDGDLAGLGRWFDSGGGTLTTQDPNGQTLLAHAGDAGRVDVAQHLIEHRDARPGDLLDEALAAGSYALCRWLLERGAGNPGKLSGALLEAAVYDDLELVRMLIERGASVAVGPNAGTTPLYCAAESGRAEAVRLLLQRGAPVNRWVTRGVPRLPFHEAISSGNLPMCKLLVDAGEDLFAPPPAAPKTRQERWVEELEAKDPDDPFARGQRAIVEHNKGRPAVEWLTASPAARDFRDELIAYARGRAG